MTFKMLKTYLWLKIINSFFHFNDNLGLTFLPGLLILFYLADLLLKSKSAVLAVARLLWRRNFGWFTGDIHCTGKFCIRFPWFLDSSVRQAWYQRQYAMGRGDVILPVCLGKGCAGLSPHHSGLGNITPLWTRIKGDPKICQKRVSGEFVN